MADCHTTIITSQFTRTKINCYVIITKSEGVKGCLIDIIWLPTRYDVVCVVQWEYETPFVLRVTYLCPLVDVLTFIKGTSWKEMGTDCDSQHLTTRKQLLILYPLYLYTYTSSFASFTALSVNLFEANKCVLIFQTQFRQKSLWSYIS